MKIIHQIANVWNESQVEYLKNFGISIKDGHAVFRIPEGKDYEKLSSFFSKWGASDWIITEFNKSDLDNASYLAIMPQWMNDYPQPENDYLKECYDLSEYCDDCGIGKIQNAPLRLKREPNWGKKQTFALNWVFDEVFVRREYYDRIFKPLGIIAKEVLIHKGNRISSSTVQLELPVTNHNLDILEYPFEECAKCGRKKYLPITKGFFPKLNSFEEHPIFKSKEYFGSGAAADKRIIISNELYRTFSHDKTNLSYYPTQL